MSEFVTVKAADGHELSAYVVKPEGTPKGALVVVQEIFGVNKHIRSVADGYAKEGYVAIAPALFDRIERGVDIDYTPDEMKYAFTELYPKLNVELALLDVAAAFQHVAGAHKTAVLGFCYGGLMAWLSATRAKALGISPVCTVGYYAGGIGHFAKEEPTCPVMLHFGAADSHIDKDQIDAVREANPAGKTPEVEVFEYEGAGHAFNRAPDPHSYHAEAAKLAGERSLAFLKKYIG
ncbi:dienelactone hydrolase family protein [Granulicella sp. 5B5]|uniref:dienelactone hydrolase family protein n=1 Tax=Granulicella sp. 5B5 TaxID=1617967 RepID=UPI0015F38F6C|nr:dienelactone hydrolase family protein [Granulicella sp. 5B5]QMV17353.1 dienelactone hydrolase family protein [Granulicella sp. 5B5]